MAPSEVKEQPKEACIHTETTGSTAEQPYKFQKAYEWKDYSYNYKCPSCGYCPTCGRSNGYQPFNPYPSNPRVWY